jgi:hypothetical protein
MKNKTKNFEEEFNKKQWTVWKKRKDKAEERMMKAKGHSAVKKWNREMQVCRMMMKNFENNTES